MDTLRNRTHAPTTCHPNLDHDTSKLFYLYRDSPSPHHIYSHTKMDEPSSSPLDIVSVRFRRALQVYQHYVDKCVPHKMNRWVAFGVLLTLFMVRIIMAQGWYVVCYTLGIYLLNLFLAFCSPSLILL